MNCRSFACVLAGCLALIGCSDAPQQPTVEPRQIDAVYRLTFNDGLVGHALFSLSIERDGDYRVETFTTPAGKIASQAINEVLEVSEGRLDGDAIQPRHFEHSVRLGEDYRRVRLAFDWKRQVLEASHGEARQTLALLADTQDRLSYLLAGAQLSRGETGDVRSIRLASLEATEPAELQVMGRETISVPHGTFEATGIERLSDEQEEHREIWYTEEAAPLPLKVLRQHDGNTIEMQLETLTIANDQPVPD